MTAGPAEADATALAGGVGDETDAGFGGEPLFGLEAFADVAELGEDLGGGADAAGAWEGHDDDPTVRQGFDGVLEAGGQLGDLGNEGAQHHPPESGRVRPRVARRRASNSPGERRPQ